MADRTPADGLPAHASTPPDAAVQDVDVHDAEVAPRLGDDELDRLLAGVEDADATYRRAWPGPPRTRQPVQVLYVPADRVGPTTARDHGTEALRLLDAHAPDATGFGAATGIVDLDLAADVRARVAARLAMA